MVMADNPREEGRPFDQEMRGRTVLRFSRGNYDFAFSHLYYKLAALTLSLVHDWCALLIVMQCCITTLSLIQPWVADFVDIAHFHVDGEATFAGKVISHIIILSWRQGNIIQKICVIHDNCRVWQLAGKKYCWKTDKVCYFVLLHLPIRHRHLKSLKNNPMFQKAQVISKKGT